MSTSVQDIIRRVRYLILDGNNVRWNDDELLMWLNDAQKELLVFKPDSNPRRITLACVAGTKQSIPADGVQLLDVVRNVGATYKQAIRAIDRDVMDREFPVWHNSTQEPRIQYYMYTASDPTTFFVYPPAIADTPIEILYAQIPTLLNMQDDVAVADIYVGAIVDYICYRCHLKDSDFAPNMERAKTHYQGFFGAMTGKRYAQNLVVQAPPSGVVPHAV